jgi:predicted acyl esterase
MQKPRTVLTALLTLLLAPAAHAATVPSVFGGRVPCQTGGVGQVCSSAGVANRVETWDGVPLDVTVTIPPPEQDGPFPLIVDLHGFAAGKSPSVIQELVPQGYVVLIYSARGQHFSCGFVESRQTDPTLSDPDACTHRGWFRLADARYEIRDTQYLAGRLYDEGLVNDAIGVTGISFGGGQTNMLAVLKDRMMMPDGSLVPWTSPMGHPMRVAAGAALIGWTDLAYALVPNGRTLDYRALNPYFDPGVSERGGVMKQSWVDGLYDAGIPTAFYAPAGADPDADLDAWKTRLDQGEPYDDDPLLRHAIEELTSHHSSYYIDDLFDASSHTPAPLFIYDGSTDDIMPFDEALRLYRKIKDKYPGAEIALQTLDGFAHPRGNLGSPMSTITYDRAKQMLTRHLKPPVDPLPGVEAYTQACGGSTMLGPFTADDWDAIHPGEVRLADAGPKTLTSAPGNMLNATADNPISDPNDPLGTASTSCRTVTMSDDDPVAATYRLPVDPCAAFTLMGSPTVIADLTVTPTTGDVTWSEIASRLWDVAPDGSMSLVTHGLYRPRSDNLGPQVFQLHPNPWQFVPGHEVKLELLGQSSPYGRASNGTFSIEVSNLELRLPVLEMPGGCVQTPAAPVLPPSAPELTTTTTQPVTTTTTTLPAQLVLGKSFQVKNPGTLAQRKVSGRAQERNSNDTIVGNPVANGATLEVIAHGTTSSDQTFSLPKEGWKAIGSLGFQYSGSGAVKKARIKKTPSGVFQVKALVLGKGGPVTVVPPDPGSDGGFILTLTGGDRYCVGFGGAAGGVSVKNDSRQWSVKRPTAEACPGTAAATTTTTTTAPGGTTTTSAAGSTTTQTATTTTAAASTTTQAGGTTTTQAGATTTTTPGATTTTLPLQQCGVFPQCGGACPNGQVCSVVFAEPPPAGEAGCVCVTGSGPCGGLDCGGDACPSGTTCQVNPFGGQCACFQSP